jgi:hypothetical protein
MGRYLGAVGVVLALCSCSSGESTVCLGHIDPIAPPAMQIQTNDGSIAAVEVVQGPCRERAGYGPYDAAPGAPSVTIERNTTSGLAAGTSDPCTIKIVALDGRCTTITATVTYHVGATTKHCADNSNCCPQSQVASFTFQRWEFTESVMQVSFGDAGTCAGYDAGIVDAAAVDAD